jgi:putative Holliday junction resolvase
MTPLTYLAFDFGEQRIGVATGSSLGLAHPLTTVTGNSNADKFAAIAALLGEWQPAALVVGLPTHADGTPHELTRLARKFAQRLHGRFGLPVFLVDERFTSLEAEALLAETGRRGRAAKPALDAVAAQQILHSYLSDPTLAEAITQTAPRAAPE